MRVPASRWQLRVCWGSRRRPTPPLPPLRAPLAQAIFGAHSVGQCTFANSGITGPWVPSATSFSTNYFKKLLLVGWDKVTTESPDVWRSGPTGPTVMLRTDVELLFNTTSPALGTSPGACPRFNGIGSGSNPPVTPPRGPFQVRAVRWLPPRHAARVQQPSATGEGGGKPPPLHPLPGPLDKLTCCLPPSMSSEQHDQRDLRVCIAGRLRPVLPNVQQRVDEDGQRA